MRSKLALPAFWCSASRLCMIQVSSNVNGWTEWRNIEYAHHRRMKTSLSRSLAPSQVAERGQKKRLHRRLHACRSTQTVLPSSIVALTAITVPQWATPGPQCQIYAVQESRCGTIEQDRAEFQTFGFTCVNSTLSPC